MLSEFRSRLVAGDLACLALDALLERLAGLGLVRADALPLVTMLADAVLSMRTRDLPG